VHVWKNTWESNFCFALFAWFARAALLNEIVETATGKAYNKRKHLVSWVWSVFECSDTNVVFQTAIFLSLFVGNEAEFPGWVLRSKMWFSKREFQKLFSDVVIRTVNIYIEEVVSDVTIFVYALPIWPKKRFPRHFRSRHFKFRLFLGTFHWYCPFGLYRYHVALAWPLQK